MTPGESTRRGDLVFVSVGAKRVRAGAPEHSEGSGPRSACRRPRFGVSERRFARHRLGKRQERRFLIGPECEDLGSVRSQQRLDPEVGPVR